MTEPNINPVSKSIFKSKTFWLNLIGIATTLSGVVPVDPHTLVYIVGGLNIANRLITEGPAHLINSNS